MHCRLSLVALLGLAATAAAVPSDHTKSNKTLPSKDLQTNKRKVKDFNLCDTGLYPWTPFDDDNEYRPGRYGLYWLTSMGACSGNGIVLQPVAISSSECSPSRSYINETGGNYYDVFRSNPPPILQCSQTYLFNAVSSKSGKACAKSKQFGDIYNTILHDFVLTAPTGSDLTSFNECIANQQSADDDDDDDDYNTAGVYTCFLTWWDVVTTNVVTRGADFGNSKLLDIDYAGDVWSFKYKGLGWNPFSTANKK